MIPDELNGDLSACSLVVVTVVATVIVTVAVLVVGGVIERVLVEWLVAIELIVDAFHFVSHVQVHAISDLAGDVVEAGHKTLKFFHVGRLLS